MTCQSKGSSRIVNLKRILHTKMKIMSSFAPSCHDLYDWYYSVEHRREMSKCFVHTMDVNDNQNCLVTNILQNIFFCILQKKESHTRNSMRVSKWWQNFQTTPLKEEERDYASCTKYLGFFKLQALVYSISCF